MNIIDSYKNFYGDLFERSSSNKMQKSASSEVKLSSISEYLDEKSVEDPKEYLRAIFGKNGTPKFSTIGGHPDFDHLLGTDDSETSSVVTLFMDMESSTRLGIIYSQEDVFKIKNTFLKMAIEVIRAFDGHVHRIMGDAVMAFFGGKSTEDNNVLDAINCASSLTYLVKNAVIPKLEELGFTDTKFGVRVGLDYGPADSVLWSSYGVLNFSEVTATSFFVDVSSKLQSQAGRNQIMLGNSLVEHLDFPVNLLEVKTTSKSGEEVEEKYLLPNITDASGNPINYKKFILKSEEYLKKTPFPVEDNGGNNLYLPVAASNYSIEINELDEEKNYIRGILPGSIFVDKDHHLKFNLKMNFLPQLPFKVKFIVHNHGKEAEIAGKKEDGSSSFHNHETVKDFAKYTPGSIISHTEEAKYRGLQYMTIKILKPSGKVLHENTMGIYIK